MKIHIDIRDNINEETALNRVMQVIKLGRISKDNTMYCYMTAFNDGINVSTNDYRKSDCFIVWKNKDKQL